MMGEKADAIRVANHVLDTPNRDPDDDLSMMSRQFLRALERREPTRDAIVAAAAAIANARGGRRGVPPITNILAILPQKLADEVMEDAEAALLAAMRASP